MIPPIRASRKPLRLGLAQYGHTRRAGRPLDASRGGRHHGSPTGNNDQRSAVAAQRRGRVFLESPLLTDNALFEGGLPVCVPSV
jgi:hypothetical protein